MRRWVLAGAVALSAVCALVAPATSGAWTAAVRNADSAGVSLWYSCSSAFTALASSALLEWNLADPVSPNAAADSSGAGTTGTYEGAHTTSGVAGPGGCARENATIASFDGSSSWVGSVKSTMPSGFSQNQTLAGWIRTPAGWAGGGDVLMLCNAAPPQAVCAQRDFRLYLTSTGAPVFATANPSSIPQAVVGSGSVTDGAWHHVAGTLSAAGMRLYVDGVDVTASSSAILNGVTPSNAASFTATRSVTSGYWHVGSGDGGTNWPGHDPSGTGATRYLKGQLTGIAVLGTALTAQQIASLYAAGR